VTQPVLSLFPGIGLLDMAFEAEGFCVVRGPDLLWGGDIKRFHPPAGKFDGVIGGPPCQAFSRLRYIVEANGYRKAENLIPEFERVVSEAEPQWFIMENVPDAPEPDIRDRHGSYHRQSVMVRDVWCGGETNRLRRFTFGWQRSLHHAYCPRFEVETMALHRPDPERAVTCDTRQIPVAIGGSGKRKVGLGGPLRGSGPKASIEDMLELQGLPRDFFGDAPFTQSAMKKMVGNGVPMALGRAVAKAVRCAIEPPASVRQGQQTSQPSSHETADAQ
jgi:DNA (cytosine-5)-methyltransferase 1